MGRVAGGPPEPNWIREPAGPGWALVGDAGGSPGYPWTGEGMDNAAVSATYAADAIGGWLAGSISEQEAIARYGSNAASWRTPASRSARRSAATSLSSRLDPAARDRAAVLVTGMSATGKSTVLGELAARGHPGVDTDHGRWIDAAGGEPLWREDRMAALLAEPRPVPLFVGGCVANQGRFSDRFDAVVLLSAPQQILLERLATRTGRNDFGKPAGERARILADLHEIEPGVLWMVMGRQSNTRVSCLRRSCAVLEDIAGTLAMRGISRDGGRRDPHSVPGRPGLLGDSALPGRRARGPTSGLGAGHDGPDRIGFIGTCGR